MSSMQLGVVIQARMRSQRLFGKVLMPIGNRPLLGHVTGRLHLLSNPVQVIVATSLQAADAVIARWCEDSGIACFRGSELDVLDRYYECARHYGFNTVVRLTADNPFTDIEELDRLIELHLADRNDYTHSFGALPIGVGAEIFGFAALERSHRDGHEPRYREHVNEYMIENQELFRTGILAVPAAKHCPDLRLTVDTEEDYRRACFVAEHARGTWVTTEEAIELCAR